MDLYALDVLMSLVLNDKVLQATDELRQQAAAALGIMTLSLRASWGGSKSHVTVVWWSSYHRKRDPARVSVSS